MGSDPLSPSGYSHENSLFRCFAHGLKMCMTCDLHIFVKLFSLSLFYELVIQLQVDICILDTILMLPNLVPSLGRWQLLGSLSFVLQWHDVIRLVLSPTLAININLNNLEPVYDVIYILNDAMDCKNNKNELTASGSWGNRIHMFYRTFY